MGCCEFIFICFQKIFYFFLISFLMHSLFNGMLFNLHEFECFWVFSLRLVSSFSPLWLEKCLTLFQFSWICQGMFCVLSCGLSLKLFHVHLKKICNLLFWDEKEQIYIYKFHIYKFYIYKLSLFDLGPCSMLQYPCCNILFVRSIHFWHWGFKIP